VKWVALAIVAVTVVLMFLYEWPRINRNQKKEKAAFVALTTIGCFLAILHIFYPSMHGLTEWIDKISSPFGSFLENK
jgi:hypothetical protein